MFQGMSVQLQTQTGTVPAYGIWYGNMYYSEEGHQHCETIIVEYLQL